MFCCYTSCICRCKLTLSASWYCHIFQMHIFAGNEVILNSWWGEMSRLLGGCSHPISTVWRDQKSEPRPGPRPGPNIWQDRDRDQGPGLALAWDRVRDQFWDHIISGTGSRTGTGTGSGTETGSETKIRVKTRIQIPIAKFE